METLKIRIIETEGNDAKKRGKYQKQILTLSDFTEMVETGKGSMYKGVFLPNYNHVPVEPTKNVDWYCTGTNQKGEKFTVNTYIDGLATVVGKPGIYEMRIYFWKKEGLRRYNVSSKIEIL